ncbi:MAG: methyltransferase domain-containing protein [Desulfobulbaceae bacterium]
MMFPLQQTNKLGLTDQQVWVLDSSETFVYSEGEEAEEYLRTCFECVEDLSVDSVQLQEKIRDWSSEYHLSPARANLIRSIRLEGMMNILELGSGCGAITRYLGEQGCTVEAVEGSRSRAELARKRCKGLANVHVVNANFNALAFPEKQYDAIFLVGVLEYSEMFLPGKKSARECLISIIRIVQQALKPDGIMVIAIENRMGLKYWLGAGEDHFGQPDIGLYGYPVDKGIQTYDKRQWERIFSDAGVGKYTFVYPFPDYKLPRVLLSDDFVADEPYAYSLLNRISSADHLSGWQATDDEYLRWKALHESGYLGEFANSFLIVASSADNAVHKAVPFDFVHFSSEGRKVQFRVVTGKLKKEILVLKKKTVPAIDPATGKTGLVSQLTHDTNYLQGTLLTTLWITACCRDDSFRYFNELLRSYWNYLVTSFNAAEDKSTLLDLLPSNIIVTGAIPSYEVIDLEWKFSRDFAADFVLFRALLWFGHHNRYVLSRFSKDRNWLTVEDFIRDCFELLSLPLPARLTNYFLLEDQFHAEVAREGLSFATENICYSPIQVQGDSGDPSGSNEDSAASAEMPASFNYKEKLKKNIQLQCTNLNAIVKRITGKLGGEAQSQQRFAEQLGPIYHDFDRVGIKTFQKGGCFPDNQKAKESVILAYILMAIGKLKASEVSPITFAELFCADGYYTMFARKFGADQATGFDNDRDGHLANALKIKEYLQFDNVRFVKTDIEKIDPGVHYSIVANIGGLYHVPDPKEVLMQSYEMAERYLIVQNVVSLSTHDENYLEIPAPGWTWGNRFSRESFDKLIHGFGWKIVDQAFNELKGNPRAEDRGSVYYLIEKN